MIPIRLRIEALPHQLAGQLTSKHQRISTATQRMERCESSSDDPCRDLPYALVEGKSLIGSKETWCPVCFPLYNSIQRLTVGLVRAQYLSYSCSRLFYPFEPVALPVTAQQIHLSKHYLPLLKQECMWQQRTVFFCVQMAGGQNGLVSWLHHVTPSQPNGSSREFCFKLSRNSCCWTRDLDEYVTPKRFSLAPLLSVDALPATDTYRYNIINVLKPMPQLPF